MTMKVVHNSYNPDTRDMTKIYALAPCGRSCIYFCHIPRNRVITIKYTYVIYFNKGIQRQNLFNIIHLVGLVDKAQVRVFKLFNIIVQ